MFDHTPRPDARTADDLHLLRLAHLQELAKLRTIPGRQVHDITSADLAATDPDSRTQRELTAWTAHLDHALNQHIARHGRTGWVGASGAITRERPRRWHEHGRYGGICLQTASHITDPATLDDVAADGTLPPVTPDYLLAADGWVLRVRHDGQWWIRDRHRNVEKALLRGLCEDPLARLALERLDPTLGGLPTTDLTELLGTPPAPRRRWWKRR